MIRKMMQDNADNNVQNDACKMMQNNAKNHISSCNRWGVYDSMRIVVFFGFLYVEVSYEGKEKNS